MSTIKFTPEPPYSNDYDVGYYRIDVKNNRKYVTLVNSATKERFGTLYSRYLFQVDYWKKYGKLIPDDMQVDHINDNCHDDRLENLQLLTQLENIRKRDAVLYKKSPINETDISIIRQLLHDKWSYSVITERFGITPGHLRHLIRTRFPEFQSDKMLDQNHAAIRGMLENGISQLEIASQFDVSQITISRYIRNHLQDVSKDALISRRLETIKDGLIKGETNVQIAEKIGCSGASVCLYIKRFFKEYVAERVLSEKFEREEHVRKIKILLDKKHTQIEIAMLLELSISIVNTLIRDYLPEYKNYNLYEERVAAVGDLLHGGATREEIAIILDIEQRVISSIITKFYPQYRKEIERGDTLEKFKELVLSGVKYSWSDIAEKLGISQSTVSDYYNTYFPEKTKIGRSNILRAKIQEVLVSTDEKLTHKQIAEKIGVDRMAVKTIFSNGLYAKQKELTETEISELKKLLEDKVPFKQIAKKLKLGSPRTTSRIIRNHFPDFYNSSARVPEYRASGPCLSI